MKILKIVKKVVNDIGYQDVCDVSLMSFHEKQGMECPCCGILPSVKLTINGIYNLYFPNTKHYSSSDEAYTDVVHQIASYFNPDYENLYSDSGK